MALASSNLPPRARHNHRGGTAFDERRLAKGVQQRYLNTHRLADNLWALLCRGIDRPEARYAVGITLHTAAGERTITHRVWRSWDRTPHWVYFDNKSTPYRDADIALLLCSPWTTEREEARVGWLFEVGYTLRFGSVVGRLVEVRSWHGITSYVFHFSHDFSRRAISEERLLELHQQISGQPPDGGASAAGAGNILLLPQPRERGRVNRANPGKVIYLFPSQTTQQPHEAAAGNDAERTAHAAPYRKFKS